MKPRLLFPALVAIGLSALPAHAQLKPLRLSLGVDRSTVRHGSQTSDAKGRFCISYDLPRVLPVKSAVALYVEGTTADSSGGNSTSALIGNLGFDQTYVGIGLAFRSQLIALPVGKIYTGFGAGIYDIPVMKKRAFGGKFFAGYEMPLLPYFAEIGVPLIAEKDFKPGFTASVGVHF